MPHGTPSGGWRCKVGAVTGTITRMSLPLKKPRQPTTDRELAARAAAGATDALGELYRRYAPRLGLLAYRLSYGIFLWVSKDKQWMIQQGIVAAKGDEFKMVMVSGQEE